MSYKVVFPSFFKKYSIKYLEKRFPNVKDDLRLALRQLIQYPKLGVVIPKGQGTRKLRIRNSDSKKGKRSGYRLIYYLVHEPEPIIYPLIMYNKSDKDDITNRELTKLLDNLAKELD